jgi:hypothetical protein
MPSLTAVKDWETIIISALALLVSISVGWFSYRQRAQEREDRRQESEIGLFAYFGAVFARPAFRGPYQWISDPKLFKKAIDDTLLAIVAGYHQTRTGRPINQRLGQSTDSERRRKMEDVTERLRRIQAIMNDVIQNPEQPPTRLLSDTDLLFRNGNLKNCGDFVWSIKNRSLPFTSFLADHFSHRGVQMLEEYPAHATPPLTDEQDKILADELNVLLSDHILDQQPGTNLRDLPPAARDQQEASISGNERRLRNRLILQSECRKFLPPIYAIAVDRERNEIVRILNTILVQLNLSALPLPKDCEGMSA